MGNKILITAVDSFTGKYLSHFFEKRGYIVVGTTRQSCDITNKESIQKVLKTAMPDYIIHLAAISFAAHQTQKDFYHVNTIGTLQLLDAILEAKLVCKKIILASSATVYGNQEVSILDESLCPRPTNHYGASKYAMETLVSSYFKKLPLLLVRPFNYTGVGQAEHFLIPKIVSHYKAKKKTIALGNLDVCREFNDIEYICVLYGELLEANATSEVVNLCSNRVIKLLDIITTMNQIAGYDIAVEVNPQFVRKDDIRSLSGSTKKLFSLIKKVPQKDFTSVLLSMYRC